MSDLVVLVGGPADGLELRSDGVNPPTDIYQAAPRRVEVSDRHSGGDPSRDSGPPVAHYRRRFMRGLPSRDDAGRLVYEHQSW